MGSCKIWWGGGGGRIWKWEIQGTSARAYIMPLEADRGISVHILKVEQY